VLSQTSEYAVRALIFLATRGPSLVPVETISRDTGLPAPFLGKVVRALAQRHLVRTRRGPGGGVILAGPVASISLFDVCRALDDPLTSERCMLGPAPCSEARRCPGHEFCTTFRASQAQWLRSISLADIVHAAAETGSPEEVSAV
jgi:Rrf2 family protein